MTELRQYQAGEPLIVRADVQAREIDVRLLEWGIPADLGMGDLEEFAAGSRIHTADGEVDAIVRRDHLDPPIGKVARVWSKADGPYATLKISRTAEGDGALALASDGTYKGPSVGFLATPPVGVSNRRGRRADRRPQRNGSARGFADVATGA